MALLAMVSSSRELDVLPAILLAPWTGSMMPNEPRFVTELSICMRDIIHFTDVSEMDYTL